MGEFLGYFMVRKVIASRALLRTAGTVTKRLAAWLAEQGYVEADEAEMAAERGAEAARELPKADELVSRLQAFAEERGGPDAAEQLSGLWAYSMFGSVGRFSSPRISAVDAGLAGPSPV